jgi:Uma2 family endonuclease
VGKLERYELLGVQEYWVVDPQRNETRIYRRAGERLQPAAELTAAARDRLTSPFFPGLEIPLFEIFL